MIRVNLASGTVTADADLTAITVAELPTGRDQVIGGIAAGDCGSSAGTTTTATA